MITIYNPHNWPSVQHLVDAFAELGVQAESREFAIPGSPVINWGFTSSVKALNNRIIGNKLKELEKLVDNKVSTVTFDTTPHPGWMARTLNHKGGRDFVRGVPNRKAAFWVKREQIEKEFRVHIINDKCVKVGLKVPKTDGTTAHPWVRSLRYGWRPTYVAGVKELVTASIRDCAKRAVRALDYDFAAVDVGVRESGDPIVFEVNTAPGLKPSIARVYAKHLKEML